MTNPRTAMVSKQEADTIRVSEQEADTIRVYVPISRRRVAEGSIALSKAQLLAGGWTCRHVAGGWLAPDGQAITEPVDEYEFLVTIDKVQAVRGYLTALSEELLASGEQAVLLVVLHSRGPTITYTLS